jgi:hypothetical protein
MKIKTLTILPAVWVAMSLTPAWAGPVGVQRSLSPDQTQVALSQLQAKQLQVGRQMPEPPKGPAMIRYMSKRSQLQGLINRIQSGQPVSPDEIDQALQPTYQ